MSKKLSKNSIAIIALIVFTLYAIVSTIFISNDINSRKKEVESLHDQIEKQNIVNDEIRELVKNGSANEEYIIKMAREKLNFVFPDETVYKDIVGN